MSALKQKHRVVILCITAAFILSVQTVFGGPDGRKRPSPANCDAYARNIAANYSEGVVGGAVRGSAKGALFGAIVGGSDGAKKGALLGGAVRGTRGAVNREQIRRQAYDDCMAGRVRW